MAAHDGHIEIFSNEFSQTVNWIELNLDRRHRGDIEISNC